MKTTIHVYRFDTNVPAEKAAWDKLRDELKKTHPWCMESSTPPGKSHYRTEWDGVQVELDTAHLFDNQWNAASEPGGDGPEGWRLFDWALDYDTDHMGRRNKIRRGYYLEQTEEMRAARKNRYRCGYCGKQYDVLDVPKFCTACIGSEHLKEVDLSLLRTRCVADEYKASPPLTAGEADFLVPLYRELQLKATLGRDLAQAKEAQRKALETYEKKIALATQERDGFLFLVANGIRTNNAIYYDHTGRFGFGWRSPMEPAVAAALAEKLKDFPAPWDIEVMDGAGKKKISGEGK